MGLPKVGLAETEMWDMLSGLAWARRGMMGNRLEQACSGGTAPVDLGILGRGQDETSDHPGWGTAAARTFGKHRHDLWEDAQDKTSWHRWKDTDR